jgi:hypothetical protein
MVVFFRPYETGIGAARGGRGLVLVKSSGLCEMLHPLLCVRCVENVLCSSTGFLIVAQWCSQVPPGSGLHPDVTLSME